MDKNTFAGLFNYNDSGFSQPVIFTDEFGFSTGKDRIQNGRDFVSLYKFFIPQKSLDQGGLVPVDISVSYGERTDEGITLTPKNIKRKLNWPIDLESSEEYFINLENCNFYKKNNKEVSPETILSEIESLHLKPTRKFGGFILRLKIFAFRKFITGFWKVSFGTFKYLLKLMFGVIAPKNVWLFDFSSRRDSYREEVQLQTTNEPFAEETINILGYEASGWALASYCVLHLFAYTIWYFFFDRANFEFVESIFNNNFLTIGYVVPTIILYEKYGPEIFKRLIWFSGVSFSKASFKKLSL